MNADILKGRWKQLKGHARQSWGRFTKDEIAAIRGGWEIRVGKLQEHYGRMRSRTQGTFDRWLSGR